jgi:hypothetical protein
MHHTIVITPSFMHSLEHVYVSRNQKSKRSKTSSLKVHKGQVVRRLTFHFSRAMQAPVHLTNAHYLLF